MTIKRDEKEKSKSQVAKKKVKRNSKKDNDPEYKEMSDPIVLAEKPAKVKWSPKFGKLNKEGTQLVPKNPVNAFMIFNAAVNVETRKKNPELSTPEICKKIGQLWKEMSDKDKKPYMDKSEASKKKNEEDLEMLRSKGYFILSDGRKSTDVHVPQEGEPTPKAPVSTYMQYSTETIPKIMEQDKMTRPEAFKKVAVLWNSLPDSDKKPYQKKHDDAKKIQEAQVVEFLQNGYFTFPDGSKSFEAESVKPKNKRAQSQKTVLGKRKISEPEPEEPPTQKKKSPALKKKADLPIVKSIKINTPKEPEVEVKQQKKAAQKTQNSPKVPESKGATKSAQKLK